MVRRTVPAPGEISHMVDLDRHVEELPPKSTRGVFDPVAVTKSAEAEGDAPIDLVHRFLRRDILKLVDQGSDLFGNVRLQILVRDRRRRRIGYRFNSHSVEVAGPGSQLERAPVAEEW
jgi:hypothetical protein